jgi:hypothetical protein
MIRDMAYAEMLGLSAVVWGGMLTLLLLLVTAAISFMNQRGNHTIPFKYHKPMAVLTIIAGTVHGLIGLLANLGY